MIVFSIALCSYGQTILKKSNLNNKNISSADLRALIDRTKLNLNSIKEPLVTTSYKIESVISPYFPNIPRNVTYSLQYKKGQGNVLSFVADFDVDYKAIYITWLSDTTYLMIENQGNTGKIHFDTEEEWMYSLLSSDVKSYPEIHLFSGDYTKPFWIFRVSRSTGGPLGKKPPLTKPAK